MSKFDHQDTMFLEVKDKEKTMKHLWLSFAATVSSAGALFISSILAVVGDDNCDSKLCLFAGWGLVFSAIMAVNSVIACYTNVRASSKIATARSEKDVEEKESLIQGQSVPLSSPRDYSPSQAGLIRLVSCENCVSMCMTLILLFGTMIAIIFWTRIKDAHNTSHYVMFTASLMASGAAEFYALMAKLSFLQVTKKDRNKMLLLASNLLLFAMGITLISMNSSLVSDHNMWMFHGMNAVGILCCISSVFGVLITAVSHSALSTAFLSSTALPIPYLLIEMFTLGTSFTFTFGNLWLAVVVEVRAGQRYLLTGLELNAAVGFVVCIVTFLIHSAYDEILNPRLPSAYVAEEVDVEDLDEETAKKWGDKINAGFGTRYIGAWDGHAAVSLMRTYANMLTGGAESPIPHTKGIILRIGRPVEDVEFGGDDSVAYVFVTVVEKFDLTRYVPGILGSVLGVLFGANGFLPILSLRWGLVGFQYPFHSGIFLVKSDQPKYDMVMVQRAIVNWKDTSGINCHVLMSPCYATQLDSQAFEEAHFLNLQVGPSVVVDLRRYHGLKYKEFQRVALKKGNRRNHHGFFQKKGGTVHVSRDFRDFDEEYAEVSSRLVQLTAQQRISRGESAVLVPVLPPLMQAICEEHKSEYRRIFGIRVQGDPAGTAVLFEFPAAKLITSDMQGLRHEVARPTKAYFAMLSLTVEKALEEGCDFVDFGPTTLEPKMDVGGRLIECRAGYHTRSMILRSLLKRGVEKFRSQQEEQVKRLESGDKGESDDKFTRAFRSYRLPFIESDFQVCDEDIKKRYNVEAKLVKYTDAKAVNDSRPVSEKKTKKQLNKEKRKAMKKAKKEAMRRAAEEKRNLEQGDIKAPSANPTLAPTEEGDDDE